MSFKKKMKRKKKKKNNNEELAPYHAQISFGIEEDLILP